MLSKTQVINKIRELFSGFNHSLKEESWKGLARNISLVFFIFLVLVLCFFFMYLPLATNHGQSLSVPDVRGMSIEEAERFLLQRDLKIKIVDSAFTHDQPRNVVLSQSPQPNAKVKYLRKVQLVVNSEYAPQVKMPDILGSPYPNAEKRLHSYGLRIADKKYVPNPNNNQVLKIFVDDEEYTRKQFDEGVYVYKNQKITLHVADGIGNNLVKMPSLIGDPLDEAEVYLLGVKLNLGNLRWVPSNKPYGTVLNQHPRPGEMIRMNQSVDLWVASHETGNNN